MAEPYTLTAADVDGCRKILARLESFDAATGGYSVGGRVGLAEVGGRRGH